MKTKVVSSSTLTVEIEAVLNGRPLTYLCADVTDPEPLTPSHLLYGCCITTIPHLEVGDNEKHPPVNEETLSLMMISVVRLPVL